MYYDYFGFNQPPFRITPDTRLFYSGGNRGAILEALLYAIQSGEGIVKVVGEVGSGKTMLCRMLEKELPANVEVVYLVNPSIAPENTLHAIAFELKLDVKPNTSRFEVMNTLQRYLLQRHSENKQVVVFVEEAQSMPIATLEEIRLLSNLETQQSKLLQIVLFGQPELDEMIAQTEIRQLKERITYSFDLTPFKTNDIREYLNTRIRASGYRAGELFNAAAIKEIESFSKGLLRRINILADKSLLAAYAENARQVTEKHTRLAARDSEFVQKSHWFKPVYVLAIVACLLVLSLSVYFVLRQGESTELPEITGSSEIESVPVLPLAAESGLESSSQIPDREDLQALATEGDEYPNPINQDPPVIEEPSINSAMKTTEESVVAAYMAPEPSVGINSESETRPSRPELGPGSSQDLGNTLTGTATIMEPPGDVPLTESPVLNQEPAIIASSTGLTTDQELLGLAPVYQLQDIGDPRLTLDESDALHRQLLNLPPEAAEFQQSSLKGDICERCWSIIYRPVWTAENL